MQKARRHPSYGLRPLVGRWFQALFTPLPGVLFTFPLRYSSTIGLSGVFSLTGWCRQIQTGLLQPRPTQELRQRLRPYRYGTVTLYGVAFQLSSPSDFSAHSVALQPRYD